MNDLEARLRRVLHEELDPVVADAVRAATVTTRARRARRLRVLAAALAALALTAGAAATAATLIDDRDDLPPAGRPPERGTFSVTLGEGRTALVVVDRVQGQVCYGFDYPIASSVTLRREHPGPRDPVVATLASSPDAYYDRKCARIDRAAAEDVLDAPEDHYIRFDVAENATAGALTPYEPPPGSIPYEAEVVCGPAGAAALTPQVRPQHDGVHVTVYNFARERGELYLVSPDGGNGIYRLPANRLKRTVVYFGPGPIQAACVDRPGLVAFHGPGSESYANLEIVDRYGLWSEPELECGEPRRRSVIPTDLRLPHASAAFPRFERLIRAFVPGVELDDVLERPGYPDAPAKIETRTVVRDGRRIAKVWLTREGDVWALVPWTCPGSGIAEEG
ncbi:MAG TPA: hypothetical protein VG318_00400 [Actinomycetota bacterium]|nr:hypothetical protein [Actinomycetota bacterium]